MIEGLKPYAEYKESDIPWAPVIPSTWQTERAKRLFTRMQRPVRPEDDVVTCFRDGMVTLRKNRRLRGFTEATVFSGYQGIRKGDLVIHGMDAFAGAIGVSDSDGKGTPVYNVCKPSPGVVASYYAHTVREMSRSQWILALAKGIRERSTDFRYEMFGNQIVPLPPPDEQAAIVRFLDHANRKIDGFIRAKRKLIGLLNEQKQAIIHRAVTGKDEVRMMKDENGNSSFILQPSTLPKKPSGIPWLGDIPKHWEVSRVKNEFKCLNPQRIPLSSTQRGAMTARLFDYYGASGVIDKVEDFIFDDELLLIAEDGANLVLRNLPLTIIARGRFWVNNHAHILKPKRGNLEYLAGFMETLNYQPWISGAAQPKLTKDRIMGIAIAVAPVSEQAAIVEYFTEKTAPLRAAIARTEREIALMQEYRTRLTADLVTGKLDVREAAAHLPAPPADAAAEEDLGELLEEPEAEEEE